MDSRDTRTKIMWMIIRCFSFFYPTKSLGCDIGFGPDHQIPINAPRSPLVEYITEEEEEAPEDENQEKQISPSADQDHSQGGNDKTSAGPGKVARPENGEQQAQYVGEFHPDIYEETRLE